MEQGMTTLSLVDDENEIKEAVCVEDSMVKETTFCLVGCFLTFSVIHFPTMRSTMTNLCIQLRVFRSWIWGRKGFYSSFFIQWTWIEFGMGLREHSTTFCFYCIVYRFGKTH